MKIWDETDLVHDSDGKSWECQWRRLEGYSIPEITRVRLREPDTDRYTHYYDAPWPADIFKLELMDGKFQPGELP